MLEGERGVLQRPEMHPRRSGESFVMGEEFPAFLQSEPQRPHAGFIVDPQQEVALGELTGLAVLFAGVDGLLAPHQQASPAVRAGVGKQPEKPLVQRHILPPPVEGQVWVQGKGAVGGGQPDGVVLKGEGLLSPDKAAAEPSQETGEFSPPVFVHIDGSFLLRHRLLSFLGCPSSGGQRQVLQLPAKLIVLGDEQQVTVHIVQCV